MVERVEEPIKYDSVPNYTADAFAGRDLGATRVPHDSPVRTTPLPPPNWFQRHEELLLGTLGGALFFVAGQGVTAARIWSRLFLPGPADVFDAFVELVNDGELPTDIAV